ncbi:MAG: THUMP domain-containing protein [Oligoflexus sp.]
MYHFAAYCLRGLETYLTEELEFHGLKTIRQHPGCVIFQVPDLKWISFLNQQIRIAEHLDLLFFWGETIPELPQIEEQLLAIDYSPWFDPQLSFAVRAVRQGQHSFQSMDLMRTAARALTLSMNRCGHEIKANLKQPQLYFRATIYDNYLTFGLSTNGLPLSQRYPLDFAHEAPLNRTIAAALLWDSSFRQHGQLVDPMCGGGTILIEAALWRQGRSLDLGRRKYDYCQHSYLSAEQMSDATFDYQIPVGKNFIGGERSPKKVAGTALNLERLNLKEQVTLVHGNARRLSYLKPRHPLVVTNPPYGIRVMRPSEVDELYRDFADALLHAEVQEVVAITPKKHSWLDSFAKAGYHLISIREILYGDMPAFIIKHHIEPRANMDAGVDGLAPPK